MKQLNRRTDDDIDIGTYFFMWVLSIPFWFVSSCERSYGISDTDFHIEINIGIPLILIILTIIFHIKSRTTKYLMDSFKYRDIAIGIIKWSWGIAIIFSILNLFRSLEWFHNFFPIFVDNTSLI